MIPDPLPRARSLSPSRLAVRSLWPAAFLLAGAGHLHAQCPPDFEGGNFVCSPPGISGSYKRLVCGDLSGDWNQEVATIKGDRLIVYHGANLYNASVKVEWAAGAIDLCFAPDTDGQGTPGFLYTTSGGLARVTFDQAEHEYEWSTLSTSQPWNDAYLIRRAPLIFGPSGADALFAVQSDKRTVFRSLKDSGGYSTPNVLFDAGYPVLDIVPLNWDTDIQLELAILHDHGVQVRELDGTLKLTRTGTNLGDAIAVVRKYGVTDSLAWITRMSGFSKLQLFNKSFTQGPTVISDQTFSSMASADLEPDGDDDLVLASSSSDGLTILRNAPVLGQWFPGTSETVSMSVGGISQASSGKVLCSNLFDVWTESPDQDGLPIPAYALVLPGSDGLRLLPQGDEGGEEGQPPPSFGDYQAPEYWSALWFNLDCQSSGMYSQWAIAGDDDCWGLTNANGMEIVVRKSIGSMTPDGPNVFTGELDHGPQLGWAFTFVGVEDDYLPQDYDIRYFVAVRPIKRNLQGAIVRTWRWSILGMSPNCDACDELVLLPGAGSRMHIDAHICFDTLPSCTHQPGEIVVPSAVPLSQIPSGPGGTLPN